MTSIIKKSLLVIAIPVVWAGCDSILSEEPKTFLSDEVVFSDEAGAISAVKGVYQPLRQWGYYNWWFTGLVEMHSDYVFGRGGQASIGTYQLDAVDVNRIGVVWGELYNGINRANNVLEKVPEIDMNPALRDQLLGEARFLRALNYYHLVRLWGDVPLRTTPTKGLEGLSAPRTSSSEVYSLILEDLEIAENDLPDSYEQSDIGRATRWAAKTLLADVYLTLERWNDAADKTKEVIDSGRFSLARVHSSDDFEKIYGPEVVTHSEEIFSVKHTRTPGLGSNIPWLLHRPAAGYSNGGVFAWPGNPNSWLKDWEEEDLRRNFNLYNGPGDESHLDETTPILFKKYKDGEGVNQDGHGNDFPVFRYPDALLIYAEAASQANGAPSPEAYEAINQVRRRAYGLDPDVPDPGGVDLAPGLSAQAFRDAVLLERAKEFCLEAKRFFDLLRTGNALDVIRASGPGKANVTEKNLRWPIPPTEIDNNEALAQTDQNPGW